jgi:ferrous iron transport protein A
MPQVPLAYTQQGENLEVVKVSGAPETRRHLETLGFVPGATLRVAQVAGGDVIVCSKGARVALDAATARRVMVRACV